MREIEAGVSATRATSVCVSRCGAADAGAGAREGARILSVSPYVSDHKILYEILNGSHWKLVAVSSWLEAAQHLGRDTYFAVFCEYAWAGGTWRDLLAQASGGPEWPLIVVMSTVADEDLWANAIELGAYDLLAKPLNVREVLDVLTSVYQYRA